MSRTTSIMIAAASLCAFCAQGAYEWTGAVDAYWTNAANWRIAGGGAVAEPPGRHAALDGNGVVVTNGAGGADVHFNTACTSGRATIDLDGLVTVHGVVVDGGASAPRYTFGTGPEQRLPIEAGGFFTAAATTDTVPPVMNCGFAYNQYATANQPNTYLTNLNQKVALEFGDFGWSSPAPGAAINLNQSSIFLRGYRGSYTFNGDYRHDPSVRIQLRLGNNSGTITVNGLIDKFIQPEIDTTGQYYHFVLGPNGVLDARGSYGAQLINTWRQLNFTGEGKIYFPVQWKNGEWASSWNLYARYTQLIDVEFTSFWETGSGDKPAYGPGLAFYNADDGEGHLVTLAGVNCVTGTIRVAGYNDSGTKHPIYEVPSFGLDGVRSGLGYGPDVQISDLATLRSTAPNENSDRTIRLSRVFGTLAEDYGGIVELSGTGSHTMACPVVCEGGSCSFTVKTPGQVAWTVPLADTSSYALSLVKAGTGTLTLEAANTYSGSTTVSSGVLAVGSAGTLGGGTVLTLAAGAKLSLLDRATDGTVSAGEVTVSGAGAMIEIGRHATLEVSSITREGSGTLNISFISGSSRLKIASLAGETAPAWITVDGGAVQVDAEGYLTSTASRWQNAAGGVWTDDANWSAGQPAAAVPAHVQLSQAELNVRIDEAAATSGKLTVENETGLTTVAVSNTVTFTAKRESRFGTGSRLILGEGGRLVYEDEYFGNDKESGARNLVNHNLHPFTLWGGGEWTIDGGHLYVTNLQGRFLVGDGLDMSVTSRLALVRGRLDFGQGGWDSGLEIRPNGLLEVSGGEFVFQGKGMADCPLKMRGGRAEFSGDSSVKFMNARGNMDQNAATMFGTGETVFRGDSRLFIFADQTAYGVGSCCVLPETDGGTAQLTFLDSAAMTNQVGTLVIGNQPVNARAEFSACEDNRAILNLFGTGAHVGGYPKRPDVGLANTIAVGMIRGYGELNMTGGRLNSGCFGLVCPSFHNDFQSAVRGRVNQSGGTLYLNAFASISIGYNPSYPQGFLLGDASRISHGPIPGYPEAFHGWYNLSGGKMSLNCGSMVVGGGSGVGRMAITGGEAVIGESAAYSVSNSDGANSHLELMTNQNFAVVGYLGGQGELVVSNGSFTCNEDFYLGGVWTNRVFHGYPGTARHFAVSAGNNGDRRDGRGRLELAGGAFTCATTFTVGACGTGVLDVMGSAGSFTAGNMVLSNDVAAVVNFRADASGVTPLEVRGNLVFAPGSRVTLDLSAFTGRRLTLFRYGSLEGELPEVELTGATGQGNHEFRLRQTGDGRYEYGFAYIRGTAILFR